MKKSLVSVILVASMMLSIGGCGLKKKNDSKILEGKNMQILMSWKL